MILKEVQEQDFCSVQNKLEFLLRITDLVSSKEPFSDGQVIQR